MTLTALGAQLIGNEAGTGGGMRLGNSEADLRNTLINENIAHQTGGAIQCFYSSLTMRTDSLHCDPTSLGFGRLCSEIAYNTAEERSIVTGLGCEVIARKTLVMGNQDLSPLANSSMLNANLVDLKNVLVVDNQGETFLSVAFGQTAKISAATIADNAVQVAAHYLSGSSGFLRRSIVFSSGAVEVDTSISLPVQCSNIEQGMGSFVTNGTTVLPGIDPQFYRNDVTAYELSVGSVGRDICTHGPSTDALSRVRPESIQGLYDQGAFEAQD